MFNKTSRGMIQTTVLLTPEFNELRKQHHITLSEAVKVGISILLAEKGVMEYDNRLNIVRQVNLYKQKAGEYAQKAANLENGKSHSK
ncbi:hypothetical protein LCGC14_0851770 [marine sediment metagenome]|uniref:Uncharacterized protein n=1 Tax=marine sediment metagenome TaxID=412755 RepID=A0A0F9P9X7_9ZZZZ